MALGAKALIAIVLALVILSITVAPNGSMAFLILFGMIASAAVAAVKKMTRKAARGADAPARDGDAVVLDVDAPSQAGDAAGIMMRRKPVSQEVELVMSRFHDPLLRAPGASEASSLRLQFITKLPEIIFTSSRIEAEDGTPLRIELVDGRTNDRVTSGPLSSIKIEIVVLDGNFWLDEGEDWTESEFNCNITGGREGRRPLIIGELTNVLQGGIGCLRNLMITDNSSWMRSRKFRLGARAVQTAEIRIREARSEAFIVKERRGQASQKHYPPLLSDEVWRLQRVAKNGARHKRMTLSGINTVQDFLQLYEADASSLKNILGHRTSELIWETIVRHASTCVVNDNKMYAFYQASNKASIQFNSVMKVAQATLDGETYQSVDKLTHSQKILVQNLKRVAYDNKKQWLVLDASSLLREP